jgi:hypothetical protein
MLKNILYYVKSRKKDYKLFIRDLKFLKQRVVRGWDDSETWSLDFTVAKFMLPRLIRFKELKCGYPCNLTNEEWDAILDEMIWLLQYHVDHCEEGTAKSIRKYDISSDEFSNRYEKASKLFGEYFGSLWW